jgi:hypothetical protein
LIYYIELVLKKTVDPFRPKLELLPDSNFYEINFISRAYNRECELRDKRCAELDLVEFAVSCTTNLTRKNFLFFLEQALHA